jgi:DNA-binding transcriptional ArsR family regulator
MNDSDESQDMSPVFEAVARYFALLSDPMRLRIMYALCNEERSVSDIVEHTGGTQTNISRHLNLMHERGALARRKEGSQVFYRVADKALIAMCRDVCSRVFEAQSSEASFREGLRHVMGEFS